MVDLPHSPGPLYEKVKNYILTNIGKGRWSHNQKLPSENALVTTLGVSRMTVNRALRELASAGFLVRVQGVGTFIAPPRPQSALIEINNIAAEIRARGSVYRNEVLVLGAIAPGRKHLEAFEGFEGLTLSHSVIVHYENERAVQLEERFVNPDLVPGYHEQDFTESTTYNYLMRKTPATEVEHVISALLADEETAARLGIEPGTCCLLLHRRTWTGSTVATLSKLTYVGSRYSLGSRYTPEKDH